MNLLQFPNDILHIILQYLNVNTFTRMLTLSKYGRRRLKFYQHDEQISCSIIDSSILRYFSHVIFDRKGIISKLNSIYAKPIYNENVKHVQIRLREMDEMPTFINLQSLSIIIHADTIYLSSNKETLNCISRVISHEYKYLKSLMIRNASYSQWPSFSHISSSITQLTCINCHVQSLPYGLEYLSCESNHLLIILQSDRIPSLKHLIIKMNNNDAIAFNAFHNLQCLEMSNAYSYHIQNLPASLLKLKIDSNFKKHMHILPDELQTLDLRMKNYQSHHFFELTQNITFPPSLKKLKINILTYFPSSITHLTFDYYKPCNQNFSNIKYLNIKTLVSLDLVMVPNLEVLKIKNGNNLTNQHLSSKLHTLYLREYNNLIIFTSCVQNIIIDHWIEQHIILPHDNVKLCVKHKSKGNMSKIYCAFHLFEV